MTTFLSLPGARGPSCGDWRVGAVLLAVLGLGATANAAAPVPDDVSAGPVVRQVVYTAHLSDAEARFRMVLRVESAPRAGGDLELLEGPLAVLPGRLPAGVSLRRDGDRFGLRLARAGECEVELEFLARVRLDDPWREVRFVGPLAGIATLEASEAQGAEISLASGCKGVGRSWKSSAERSGAMR